MADAPMTTEQLAAGLTALRRDVAFPATPRTGPAVVARLTADRAARARPTFPVLALWSRRRVLVTAAVGLLAALALAAAARLAIGAVEIRVQPGAAPTVSLPPVEPDVLGEPIPVEEATALAGFEPGMPAGPAPDEAYVVDSPFGPGLVYAWRLTARYPAIPGTSWGLVLMAFEGDDEFVVKDVQAFEDVQPARVNGRPAFWIRVPHVVTFVTERGELTLSVSGNVLIWEVDGLTYRLETALGRAAALELAETVG